MASLNASAKMTETVWPDDILENAGVVSSNLPISCEWLRSSPECPMCRVSEDLDSVLIPHPISCVTMWCGWCGHALLHSVIYLSGRKKKCMSGRQCGKDLGFAVLCGLALIHPAPIQASHLPLTASYKISRSSFHLRFFHIKAHFFCWHLKKNSS